MGKPPRLVKEIFYGQATKISQGNQVYCCHLITVTCFRSTNVTFPGVGRARSDSRLVKRTAIPAIAAVITTNTNGCGMNSKHR